MPRFLLLLSLMPLAGCFNPTGNTSASDASTSSGAMTTADTTTTGPTSSGPTTTSPGTTADTTSTDPTLTTLPDTTGFTTLPGTSGTTLLDTTGTTLPDTTGTTDIGPTCGNGLPDVTEECDDGDMDNSNACLNNCKIATCGDGVVHAGVEECDDGNLLPVDGCEPDCKSTGPLLVFLVDDPVNPIDVKPPGIDAMCTALAANKFTGRKFVGWISTGDSPVSGRLGPDDISRAYARTDGMPVAKDRAALLSGTLQNPISVDVNGLPIAPGEDVPDCNTNPNLVWTGTNIAGAGTKSDCVNWTALMGQSATVGSFAATDASWTNKCSKSCGSQLRYYCVEVQQ